MRGIILAAGKGSRIGSDVLGLPKSFLEVNGKKIIQHQIDALRNHGVKEIVIVVGYKNWVFEEEFKDQSDIKLVKNPFYSACNVLGSLWFALNYMDQGFYFMHADTIFDPGVLPKLSETPGEMRFAVEFKGTVEEEMKVKVVQGFITEVNKTMDCAGSQGEFTGVAYISSAIVPVLKKAIRKIIERDQELNSFFEHAVQQLIDAREVKVVAVDIGECRSIEIDFPEDYERAKKTFGVK